mgnify:CR=1 FL=1
MGSKRQASSTKSAHFTGKSPTDQPDVRAAATEISFRQPQGDGGETHQTANAEVETLTTQQGVPISDDQNTLRVGARGGNPRVSRGAPRSDAAGLSPLAPLFVADLFPALAVLWPVLFALFLRQSISSLPDRQATVRFLTWWTLACTAKFLVKELVNGQTNALLGVLVMLALGAVRRRRPVSAALFIGLAAFVKPYALLFIPWESACYPAGRRSLPTWGGERRTQPRDLRTRLKGVSRWHGVQEAYSARSRPLRWQP